VAGGSHLPRRFSILIPNLKRVGRGGGRNRRLTKGGEFFAKESAETNSHVTVLKGGAGGGGSGGTGKPLEGNFLRRSPDSRRGDSCTEEKVRH